MILLILAVALGGAVLAWLRAAELAATARDERDEARRLARLHQKDARCFYQQLQTANATARQYRRRLAQHESANPARITDVDEFLKDLFRGGQR